MSSGKQTVTGTIHDAKKNAAPRTSGEGHGAIRVLLVDDHAVLRQALHLLLRAQPELDVVGGVTDGREAVLAVARLDPDVVLIDIVMPGLNGVEATRQIRRASPSTKVVMLTAYLDEEQLLESIRAGSSGYILKTADSQELLLAIRTAYRGNNRYFSAAVNDTFDLGEVLHMAKKPGMRTGADALTPREREVLQLIAEGYTNKGVGGKLLISAKTVESHRSHIMAKLHAHNRTDLIRSAIRMGVVHLEIADEASPRFDRDQVRASAG